MNQKMLRRLQENPPRIVVFDYGGSDDLAAVDKEKTPDIIFVTRTLISSLEQAGMFKAKSANHQLTTLYSWQLGDPPTIHFICNFLP